MLTRSVGTLGSHPSRLDYLLAIERIIERIRMTENATKMICRVLVRRAASRFSVCREGLFFDFLFAILTHLSTIVCLENETAIALSSSSSVTGFNT